MPIKDAHIEKYADTLRKYGRQCVCRARDYGVYRLQAVSNRAFPTLRYTHCGWRRHHWIGPRPQHRGHDQVDDN
jgi:hypothetical protein